MVLGNVVGVFGGLGWSWGRLGVVLGSSVGVLGVILGSFVFHLGITVGSSWGRSGVDVGWMFFVFFKEPGS